MATALLKSKGVTSVTSAETNITFGGRDSIKCDNKHIQTLVIRLDNVTTDLNTLKIYGLVHDDDTVWVPLAVAAVDYTGSSNRYVKDAQVYTTSTGATVDRDLASIAAAQYGLLVLAVPGFAQIKVTATTASSTATVTSFVQGYSSDVQLANPSKISSSSSIAANAEATVITAVSDGDLVGLLTNLYRYLKIQGLNESLNAVDTNEVAPNAAQWLQTVDFVDQLWDASPANSTITYDADLRGYERFGLAIYFDLTAVGLAPDLEASFAMSYDGGTTFVNIDLINTLDQGYDQLTGTITVDENFLYISPPDMPLGVLRVSVESNNTDADDLAQANIDLFAKKG